MLQRKRSPVSAWRWERVWYIVELRLETRPRQIIQSPENPNERFGLYLWAEGNHGTVFRNGNSWSNLHVRRTVLIKNILVINKKLKQQTKKMIQESSAYTRSTTGSHKGLEPEMVISIRYSFLGSLFLSLTTRCLLPNLCFIILSVYTGFSSLTTKLPTAS